MVSSEKRKIVLYWNQEQKNRGETVILCDSEGVVYMLQCPCGLQCDDVSDPKHVGWSYTDPGEYLILRFSLVAIRLYFEQRDLRGGGGVVLVMSLLFHLYVSECKYFK